MNRATAAPRRLLGAFAVSLVLLGATAGLVSTSQAVFVASTASAANSWATAEAFALRWSTVTVGTSHSCALDSAGSAWCWGAGFGGRLGTGNSQSSSTPVKVAAPSGMAALVAISTTNDHTCAVATDGRAWCWGPMYQGQAGNGIAGQVAETPVQVSRPVGASFAGIAAGRTHTCARTSDGRAWCWGENGDGRVGDGSTDQRNTPAAVSGLSQVTHISAGGAHSCAVQGGAAWCWGQRTNGKIGDGATAGNQLTPVRVATSTGMGGAISSISAASEHSCALEADGRAWCWGSNAQGRLGDGSVTSHDRPRLVAVAPSSLRMASIAGGHHHTCASDVHGEPWCWGSNGEGRLGDGTVQDRHVPTRVARTTMQAPVVVLAGGERHTCAVDAGGAAWCWGENFDGRLGTGSAGAPRLTPQVLPKP